jgi:hypothetical protein
MARVFQVRTSGRFEVEDLAKLLLGVTKNHPGQQVPLELARRRRSPKGHGGGVEGSATSGKCMRSPVGLSSRASDRAMLNRSSSARMSV